MIFTDKDLIMPTEEKSGDLRVIYYNVYGYGKLDGIPDRIIIQSEMLFSLNPDIICLQEFDNRHRAQSDLFSSRGYVEVPVDGKNVLYGSKKNCEAMFYLPENLTLCASGGELFKEKVRVGGINAEGNNGKTKSFTWAHFRDKSGSDFLVVNAHLMWNSPALTLRQATLVREDNLRCIFRLLSRFDGMPLIFGGDLNSTENSVPYKKIASRLTPAGKIAKKSDNYGFYHSYAQFDGVNFIAKEPVESDDGIDHVFVRFFDVLRYTTVTCPAALISSDHLPKICDTKTAYRET